MDRNTISFDQAAADGLRTVLPAARNATEAVILAAGRGSRLKQFTEAKPKCFAEVGGAPLIEHQLRALEMAGIERVSVVTGYRHDDVRRAVRGRARVIRNEDWSDTNSLYSLSLCRGRVSGPMLVMNCDVLIHPLALQRLVDAPGSAFLYDSSSGDADEHMKVELAGDGRLKAMSKTLPADRTHGENVGVLHFDSAAAKTLFREAACVLAEGDRNAWMARAVERAARSVPLRGVNVADLPWIEIDFPDDLERARTQVWRHIAHALAPSVRLAA
ncbi:phosphocholine cytidylyltransferase family protein [Craurococcus roseus]